MSNRVLGLRSLSNSSLMQMYICQLTFDPVPSSHQVISALLQTMEDQTNPRVQAHAAAALINFTEDCPKSLLIPYLDSLVQHLHVIMVAKLQEVCLSMCAVFLSVLVRVLKTFPPTRYFSATVLYGLAVRPFWEIKGLFSTTGFSRCRNLLLNVRLHLQSMYLMSSTALQL